MQALKFHPHAKEIEIIKNHPKHKCCHVESIKNQEISIKMHILSTSRKSCQNEKVRKLSPNKTKNLAIFQCGHANLRYSQCALSEFFTFHS